MSNKFSFDIVQKWTRFDARCKSLYIPEVRRMMGDEKVLAKMIEP